MPNLDNFLDMVAEKLDTEEGEALFSSVDMTYVYGQTPLHQLTAKQCNFQTIGGESTEKYSFVTGFMVCLTYAKRYFKSNGHFISKI